MTFLLLIVGVAAAIWGTVLLVRGGLIGGCLLTLLAGSCFGHPFFHVPMSPMPLTLDRLLWVVVLAQYVAWRQFGWADPKPLGKAEFVTLLFMAALAVSTLAHDWHIKGSMPLSRLFFEYSMPVGMYWVARQARMTEQCAYTTFACLAVFGIYLALTGIAEVTQHLEFAFPRYIVTAEYTEFFGRARGPFLNPVGCGIYLSVCLCAALAWWRRLTALTRPALVMVAGLMLIGIYCTLTRSVWMGGLASLVITVGLTVSRTWRVALIGGVAVAGALVVATQWERLVAFKRDKELTAAETAESTTLRPVLATVAWNMFLDRPWLGCGFGQYEENNGDYASDRSTDLPLEKARPYVQHNVWLSLLTETGLVGTVLFSLMLFLWGRNAWQIWSTPTTPEWSRRLGLLMLAALGAYLPNAVFHDIARVPMANMLLFFMAGLSQGQLQLARRLAPENMRRQAAAVAQRLQPA
jgi:O-antigen ligase